MLIQMEDYMTKIRESAKDTTKFTSIQGRVTGKVIWDLLSNDIFIQHELKHVFPTRRTFRIYTEVDEVYRQVVSTNIPNRKEWNRLCTFQD